MKIKMENLSIEDKAGIEFWVVVHKIKKLQQYHIEPDKVEYHIFTPTNLVHEEMPFEVKESQVLNALHGNGAIKIHSAPEGKIKTVVIPELSGLGKTKRIITIYYLEILQPKFSELYEEYKTKWEEITKVLVKRFQRFDRKAIQAEIARFIKRNKFGIKEAHLLRILSDFQPHKTKDLRDEIKTESLTQLRRKVSHKLKATNIAITTFRGGGHKPDYYQLEFLTIKKILV